MRIISRNLVEETLPNVSTTGYCAEIDCIKDFTFSFVEGVVIEIIHRGVLDMTLKQSSNCWSRLDTFMKVLIEKIVNNPGFIAPVDALVLQGVIKAVEEELNREPPVTKKIL